ncbi:MAG: ZIP family metal transporter [Candidatus Berkelbacteria bacterium]|nr:MAG: ZIP family metal transporter [Candidatus Berkelbacteria bacterium]QQG51846.1 MAG: ZIP family metal transporter [Candidatus Berkelbacteria bacterium]
MSNAWFATIASVTVVSLVSLIGAFVIAVHDRRSEDEEYSPFMHFLIALAVGALLGDAMIHLLPEAFAEAGQIASLYVGGGFIVFLILEKFLHWRHHHRQQVKNRIEPVGVMNLVGDGLHNFIDGALIAASYLISFPIGLATTIAVVLHEIPQELGDYAILRSAGFSKRSAIFFNFVSALFAIVGAVVVLSTTINVIATAPLILAFTAGGFIYIVLILLKKLGEELTASRTFGHIASIVLGILLMWALKFIE